MGGQAFPEPFEARAKGPRVLQLGLGGQGSGRREPTEAQR